MWSSILFGVTLLVLCGLMLFWHARAWEHASHADLDEPALDFFRRQYRRRKQASAMIGVVGLAVIGGIWISEPILFVAHWVAVTVVVFWMGILALADLVSTRFYYAQLRQENLTVQASLRAELERTRNRGANGRPKSEEGQEPNGG